LIEDSVKIGKMANEKLTGEACVLFENTEDAKMAFNDRYKQYIGTRFIELFQITAEEHTNFENDQAAKYHRDRNHRDQK